MGETGFLCNKRSLRFTGVVVEGECVEGECIAFPEVGDKELG